MKKLLFIGLVSVALVACSHETVSHNTEKTEKSDVSVQTEKSEKSVPVVSDNNVKSEKAENVEKTEKTTSTDTTTSATTTTTSDKNAESNTANKVANENVTNEVEKPKTDDAVLSAEGTFYGLADNTSLEIESNGDSNVYTFSENLTDTVNAIPFEGKVKFQYKKNGDGQLILLGIQEIK